MKNLGRLVHLQPRSRDTSVVRCVCVCVSVRCKAGDHTSGNF